MNDQAPAGVGGHPGRGHRQPRNIDVLGPGRGDDGRLFDYVWQIYDEYRTELFHSLFFETKVARFKRNILGLDIVVAVGTSTSGIAGVQLWHNPKYASIWAGFAAVAATLAILKPILRWDAELALVSKLFTEHCRLADAYDKLVKDVAVRRGADEDIDQRRERLIVSYHNIDRVPQTPQRLVRDIQDTINKEYPVTSFWSPPKPASAGS
jgi:hypothetical protein